MRACQRNVLGDGREQFPEHLDLEHCVAVYGILDLAGLLVELQADVPHFITVIGQFEPLLKAAYETRPGAFW